MPEISIDGLISAIAFLVVVVPIVFIIITILSAIIARRMFIKNLTERDIIGIGLVSYFYMTIFMIVISLFGTFVIFTFAS